MRVSVCLALGLVVHLAACTHVRQQASQATAAAPPAAPGPASVAPSAPPAPPLVQHAPPAAPPATPSPRPKPRVPARKPVAAAADAKPATTNAAVRTPTASPHPATPPVAATATASVPSTPKPELDFKAMEQRLRDTSAIGVFTKLSIKNQVDDLLKAFREYHAGHRPPSLDELHQRYDGLLLKVVTLVQNEDATLASSISASRTAIWERLSNAQSFEAI